MELCSSQSGGKKKNCKALIRVGNFNTFVGGVVEESHCVGQADLKFTELLLLSPEPWDERCTSVFINTSVKPPSI